MIYLEMNSVRIIHISCDNTSESYN